ncbi:MAG: FprA family A-type flavoprotein [Candidatus Bathyarchaeia archaeon]|nr:FprA family A-type flavoprotein [Candidatus Bathyarchaeota archaeon]
MRYTPQVSDNVYWVGVKDWKRKLFDSLIPLPKGTSYNAYLVLGGEKTVLIDTVNPGFEKLLEERIKGIINLKHLDYVVMNHAEPDHAGAIPYVMALSGDAKLVATAKGAEMAERFYNVPRNRIIEVGGGSTLNLGDEKLEFIEAPMLHWPETMFTYLTGDGVLFPCDFFGAHTAEGFYDADVEDLDVQAQRYFGGIMMPYRSMAAKALEKIKHLKIEVIAPSHGPIYRDPSRVLNKYHKWVNGETKRKVTAIYASMWGSTEKMVAAMAEVLLSNGLEVVLYDLASADIGDVAKDLVDSEGLVLGVPTVLGGAHPLSVYATYLIKVLRPPLRYAVVLGSYGWGGGAVKQILDMMGSSKIEVLGTLEVNGPPSKEELNTIVKMGDGLSNKILEASAL